MKLKRNCICLCFIHTCQSDVQTLSTKLYGSQCLITFLLYFASLSSRLFRLSRLSSLSRLSRLSRLSSRLTSTLPLAAVSCLMKGLKSCLIRWHCLSKISHYYRPISGLQLHIWNVELIYVCLQYQNAFISLEQMSKTDDIVRLTLNFQLLPNLKVETLFEPFVQHKGWLWPKICSTSSSTF